MRWVRLICLIYVFLFVLIFPPTAVALGEPIKITEIMYDLEGSDTDREWIEIKNTSSSDVDLSGWKFFDGSNHILNAPPVNGGQGSLILTPASFAVITQNAVTFLSEHPSYDGTVIDSVVGLVNTGDTIRILDATNQVIDEVAYSSSVGAGGDGNSLSWYQTGWVSAVPSPGADSVGSAPPSPPPPSPPSQSSSGSGSSNSSSQKPVIFADAKKEPVWKTSITPSLPALFVHVPFKIHTKVMSPKNTEHTTGKFVYNLGDGRVIERRTNESFGVEYQDSGNYIIYFEYYKSIKDSVPVVTEQLLISVEDVPIIVSVSKDKERKVTLSNLHPSVIDISGWTLKDSSSAFVFPNNTFLPGNRKTTINSRYHKLTGPVITLETPTSKVVSTSLLSKSEHTHPLSEHNVSITTTGNESVFLESVELPPEVQVLYNTPAHQDIPNQATDYAVTTKHSFSLVEVFGLENSWTLFFIIFLVLAGIFLYLYLKKDSELTISTLDQEDEIVREAMTYTIKED